MAPRPKYWWRIDLYEPDEMTSARTHGLPFRRIEFRGPGKAHVGTGKHRKLIQERLAKIGYRVLGTLERGSLKPRGEWEWRGGLWLAQQKPGKEISGRVSQMERPFFIGPGPDEPVPKARGVRVIDWPRGRPNPAKRKLPPEQEAELVAQRGAGATIEALAAAYSLSRNGVRGILARHGAETPRARPRWTQDFRDTLERQMRAGAADRALAREHGVSIQAVRAQRARAGIPPLPSGGAGVRTVDPSLQAEIEERLMEGQSSAAVARDLGVSRERVRRIRATMGFERGKKLLAPQEAALETDYLAGKTYAALASAYGISIPGVRLILKRLGTPKRGRRRRSLTDEEIIEVRDRHAAGEDQADLAGEYGVTQKVVLAAAGGPRPGPGRGRKRGSTLPLRAGQIAAVTEAFRGGTPASRIARDTGLSAKRIAQVLEDAGLHVVARRETTPEETQAFVGAYQGGESGTSIARRMGASHGRVMAALREAGVPIRRGGRERSTTPEQEAAMVRAYQEGATLAEAGAAAGATYFQARRALMRAGVERRHPGGATGRRQVPDEKVLAIAEDYEAGLSLAQVAERHGLSTTLVIRLLRSVGTQTRPQGAPSRGRQLAATAKKAARDAAKAEQDAAMAEDHLGGLSVAAVAEKYGVDTRTVKGALRRTGTLGRVKAELEQAMADDYLAGLSVAAVAQKHGVGLGVVQGALRRTGTPSRGRGRPKKKRKKNPRKKKATKRERRKLLNKLLRL